MIETFLPNLRLITIPSDGMGEDWFKKSIALDGELSNLSLDIAEETVFLLFSNSPSDALENFGRCLIARSVIGPKSDIARPYALLDYMSQKVWSVELSGPTFTNVLEQAEEAWTKASVTGKILKEEFILKVSRQIKPNLEVKVEAIFHE